MNARGISPAALQVLAMLICRGGGGYPISGWEGSPFHVRGGGVSHPSPRSGGTPSQVWGVSYPMSVRYPIPCLGGYPISGPGGGYPIPGWGGTWGTPHHLDLARVPPPHLRPEMGYPLPEMGYPPQHPDLAGVPSPHPRPGQGTPSSDLRWGTPPPSHKCEQTENITFPPSFGCGRVIISCGIQIIFQYFKGLQKQAHNRQSWKISRHASGYQRP